jgi:RNA polymerase-binding transcription factor DksA
VATALRPDQLAELRAQLVEQKAFRERQLRSLAGAGAADGRRHQEIADMLRSAARTALRDVEDALARMRAGNYGRCVGCGSPLPLARLEVLPQAARCMTCQREADPR